MMGRVIHLKKRKFKKIGKAINKGAKGGKKAEYLFLYIFFFNVPSSFH